MLNKEEELDTSNTISAKEADYLYVKTSQLPMSGNGLHTAIDIYKNEIIALFKGEILSDLQASIRVENKTDQYFINLLDGTILDSMKTECFAKYANDASGYANTLFKNNSKIALDENNRVCLIATKPIKMGGEIFCSYGKKYWKKHGI